MKKIRIVFALLTLLPFSRAFAQMGEIIYKDFDPDPYLFLQWSYEEIYIDLALDSTPDIFMAYYLSLDDVAFKIESCQDNFQICISDVDDIISENNDWSSALWGHPNPDRFW